MVVTDILPSLFWVKARDKDRSKSCGDDQEKNKHEKQHRQRIAGKLTQNINLGYKNREKAACR